MEILRAGILGVVQGLTEFLPVSSDGHLVLVRHLFAWPDDGLAFDAALHLGTFLALLSFFGKTVLRILWAFLGRGELEDRRLGVLLILATIPAAVVGYIAEDAVATTFRSLAVAGTGFLVSAGILLLSEWAHRKRDASGNSPTPTTATAMGIAQIFALLPGLSRSGSTMGMGMLFGLSRERATEFSFLMALPITGGAGVVGLLQGFRGGGFSLSVLVGLLGAFVSGIWAIRFLLGFVRRHTFVPFVLYLLAAAAVTFVLR